MQNLLVCFILFAITMQTSSTILPDINQQTILTNTSTDQFSNQYYIGNYQTSQSSQLFGYLDVTSGTLEWQFVNDAGNIYSNTDQTNAVLLYFYNPIYHDLKNVNVYLDLNSFDNSTNTWAAVSSSVTVQSTSKQQSSGYEDCFASYSIQLTGDITDKKSTNIVFSISSSDPFSPICNFDITANLQYNNKEIATILYCSFITVFVLLQILAAYKQLKVFSTRESQASKLSLITVGFCNVQDLFVTLLHMYLLVTQDYYPFYILPILLMITLSIFFDMKLLLIVWREKYKNQLTTPADLRKKLTLFYVVFYIALFSYLTLMYFFAQEMWVLYIQIIFIVPQIVHNVYQGNDPRIFVYYIFGVLGLRIVLPLYFRGCPKNIYVLQPSLMFCVIWSSAFVLQILILIIQGSRFGPRFFIPKRCIPGYFQYEHQYQPTTRSQFECCPICLRPLNNVSIDDKRSLRSISSSLLLKKAEVLKGPCNHMFHPDCLRSWINVKLQCPTCRGPLPALN